MMYRSSVPVAAGWWHSGGTDGPGQAAQLGQYMNQQKAVQSGQAFGNRLAGLSGRGKNQATQRPRPYIRPPQQPAPSPVPQQQFTGLYSPSHTQRTVNQAFGQAMASADPRMAQKASLGRGLSLDAGTMASAMPQVASGIMNASLAANTIPIQDYLANQQWGLQGQQMQGQEFLGMANLLRQMQNNQFDRQQTYINPLLSYALGG